MVKYYFHNVGILSLWLIMQSIGTSALTVYLIYETENNTLEKVSGLITFITIFIGFLVDFAIMYKEN